MLDGCLTDARRMPEGYPNPSRFRRFGVKESRESKENEGSKQKQAKASTSQRKRAKSNQKQNQKATKTCFTVTKLQPRSAGRSGGMRGAIEFGRPPAGPGRVKPRQLIKSEI